MQMGVEKMFLDSATQQAHDAWVSSSLGFSEMDEAEYEALRLKHSIVHNISVRSRLVKDVPSKQSLLSQVLYYGAVCQQRVPNLFCSS